VSCCGAERPSHHFEGTVMGLHGVFVFMHDEGEEQKSDSP